MFYPFQELSSTDNQIVINNGETFQRVTVVPTSDTTPSELSYVLIVQQPDDKEGDQTDGDQDMTGNLLYAQIGSLINKCHFLLNIL